MKNVITIQTEYIEAMGAISQSNRNYYTILTKAARKSIKAMMALGLSQSDADRAFRDAHDMTKLGGAR